MGNMSPISGYRVTMITHDPQKKDRSCEKRGKIALVTQRTVPGSGIFYIITTLLTDLAGYGLVAF
jgi:hypothetical protein